MYVSSLYERPSLSFQKQPITKGEFGKFVELDDIQERSDSCRLTVAVVAFNEREQLTNLVAHLVALRTSASEAFEILLVDNGLDDDIAQGLRQSGISYVKTIENVGCSQGRNIASAFAKGELIAFLDADAEVEADYVGQLLSAMTDPNVICARGRVRPLTPGSQIPNSYDLGDEQLFWFPTAEGISVWRNDKFKAAGGFEADLYGGEGVVLCHRMIEFYGASMEQFIYFPQLILRHDYNKDVAHLQSKEIRNRINRWSLDRKYPMLTARINDQYALYKGKFPDFAKDVPPKIKKISLESQVEFNHMVEQLGRDKLSQRLRQGISGTSKPRFSVVVPCFNLGEYLHEAVDSVLSQTLDDVELIVVDDCSDDPQTIASLAKVREKATVLRTARNSGVAAARNLGIAQAKADYVVCLDADDRLEITYLEDAYNLFESSAEVGVVASWVAYFGARRGHWKPLDKPGLADAFAGSPIPQASSFRKSIWQQVGGYDEQMRGYEDWEFWIRVLATGSTARVMPRFGYHYRVRPDSKVNTSHANAANLVSHIVSKNRELFGANLEQVVSALYLKTLEAKSSSAKPASPPLTFSRRLQGHLLRRKKNLRQQIRRIKRRIKKLARRAPKGIKLIVRSLMRKSH